MSVNLIEMAKDYLTPSILSKLGDMTGLSPQQSQKAMGAVLPTALAGLLQSASTESGAKRLAETIDEGGYDGSMLENLENISTDKLGSVVQGGKGLLGNLFGGKTDAIGDLLSRFAGVNKSSILMLLGSAVPMLMSLLGKLKGEQGLRAGGLRELLLSQKDVVSKFAPPGLANVMGLSSLADLGGTAEAVRAKAVGLAGQAQDRALDAYSTAHRPSGAPSNASKWLLAGLACLAALAAIWWLRDRFARAPETPVTPVVRTPSTPAAPTLQGEPVSGLVNITLPSGATLRLEPGSAAMKLMEFFKNRPAGTYSHRVVLDDLRFEPAGTLTPGGQQLIERVTTVVKEYPDARLRVRSFTIEGGTPQGSIERANQVRAKIIDKGVPTERVTAEAGPSDATAPAGAAQAGGWTELIVEPLNK